MMTRQDYLDTPLEGQPAAHRCYYAQFVTAGILDLVERCIGLDRIQQSTDPHLNDIPLKRWDNLMWGGFPASIAAKLREAGDYPTASAWVCITKEAARQIRDR